VVRVAIAFLGGTCCLMLLDALPGAWFTASLLVAGATLAFACRGWAPIAFASGFAWCWLVASDRLDQRLDQTLEGTTIGLKGVVASVPQRLADGVRFRLATDAADRLPPLVELTWYEPAFVPRAAERLDVVARLRRPRGFANPGGMDQEARMLREGIGATGYVRSATRAGRDLETDLRYPVLVLRGAADATIRRVLGDRPATGIVAGLAVGLQDALSQDQWRALARSGTSHLMAISGMHIGMFAAVAAWLAAVVQRWRQRRGALGTRRDSAVLVGTAAAYGYSLLAGWSVPTQRTMIMIALVALALRSRRRLGPGDALAAGAIVVLALDPLAPLAPGFWLSFGAVAAILLAAAGLIGSPGLVAGFARTQLAVTLGLVPVLVGSFGSVSLVSALVNVLAIPLYTLVIVPVVLIATALAAFLPVVGAPALHAVAWLIEATWPLIAAPAAWPLATWGVAALPAPLWIALVVGAGAAIAPLPAAGRVAGVLTVLALCAWRPAPVEPGAVRFALLDVGQGLASVVETRTHVLVFDAGPDFRSGTDTGVLVVEPYLRNRALRRVDVLVGSHDDADHVGGADSLARLAQVDHMVASGRALDRLGRVESCRCGRRWTWDGVRFEWLHPTVPLLPKDNDRSCVLLVRAGEHTLLLTGDIERAAEQQVLQRGRPVGVDVLVVPHHGSRSSSGPAFVAATHPRWALVAAGYRNRWGFPAPAVVERWASAGAQVLDTASSGAIELDLRPGRPAVVSDEWRKSHRRPWQDP
jgi:competence protein ComEC